LAVRLSRSALRDLWGRGAIEVSRILYEGGGAGDGSSLIR